MLNLAPNCFEEQAGTRVHKFQNLKKKKFKIKIQKHKKIISP